VSSTAQEESWTWGVKKGRSNTLTGGGAVSVKSGSRQGGPRGSSPKTLGGWCTRVKTVGKATIKNSAGELSHKQSLLSTQRRASSDFSLP